MNNCAQFIQWIKNLVRSVKMNFKVFLHIQWSGFHYITFVMDSRYTGGLFGDNIKQNLIIKQPRIY